MTSAAAYAGRTVLLTGGLGFMGSNVARALGDHPAEIRVLSRSWPSDHQMASNERVRFFKGDIRNAAAVEQAVAGCDFIFHFAGKSGPADSTASPIEDLDVNCRGLLILLEACRSVAPSAKVVFPSSRLVYGPNLPVPVAETAPLAPISIYGTHKLAAEGYLRIYSRLYGLKAVTVRLTNPYGPFQRPEQNRYGIVNWFVHQALKDQALTVYGDGQQLRDYVYIDDAVEAMLMAGTNPACDNLAINVGAGRPTSFVEMAELVIQLTGTGRIEHVPWPEVEARVETGDFVADTSLIEKTLGWRATTSLERGLDLVVSHYAGLARD